MIIDGPGTLSRRVVTSIVIYTIVLVVCMLLVPELHAWLMSLERP